MSQTYKIKEADEDSLSGYRMCKHAQQRETFFKSQCHYLVRGLWMRKVACFTCGESVWYLED